MNRGKKRSGREKGKHSISFRWKMYVCILSGSFILILGGVIYYVHQSTPNDSSADGSEVAEEQQQTIPADVKRAVDQELLSENPSSSQVLGTQSQKTPFPIPNSVHVPILMYHYVEYVEDINDTKRIALNTTPYTLEDEVKTLSNAGYSFMTHKELVNVLHGKMKLPKKPILLTFDDGYRDFYTDAYPILKKYHAKATQYVIAGFLNQQNHLLTSQLKEIAAERLVEIGAHTVHHVWLKGQSLETVTDEIRQSKTILETLIRTPVLSFAYPFGAFDEQARQVVIHSGFDSAMSTIPGIEENETNKYFFYRLRPGGRTGKALLSFLESK